MDEIIYVFERGVGWIPKSKILDDLLEDMRKSVFETLASAPRVPYTDAPIRMLHNMFVTVRGRYERGN